MTNWTDEAFRGYLAGFLDGEGCIEIHKAECGVRIRLANTEREALDFIRARLGFGRVEEYRRPTGMNYKRLYCYAVSSAPDVERLLLLVRPYIFVKAVKADVALAIIGRQRARMLEIDRRNKEVLAAIDAGEMQKVIAARYGISQATISRIKNGHLWACEIGKLNARSGLKKGIRPSDQIFRLHGLPPS